MNGRDLPLGFNMALAQNMDAMQVFSALSPQEQQEIINRTHQVNSRSEMQRFVQALADRNHSFTG